MALAELDWHMMAAATPARIEDEINKQLRVLSNLRAQKNSFLPIFRLPPETLANIFIRGARDYYDEVQYDPPFQVPGWVNVSYVCCHWRGVALHCPVLWSYHFPVSLRWTEELLVRSKRASLKIRIRVNPLRKASRLLPIVETLLSHIERTQELCLDIPLRASPSKLSLRAPRLQVLDIHSTWSHPSDWPSTTNDMDTSSLRILKLDDCPLPWYSFNLSCVTTLFLCSVPAPKQNLMALLATLTRMQALTVLHLEDAFACPRNFLSSGASDLSSDVSLPPLTRLFVGAPLSRVVAFLSCANVPLQTRVRLEFQPENGSSIDDFSQIPSIIAKRLGQSSSFSLKICSLVMRFPLSYESTFAFSLSMRDDRDPDLLSLFPPRDSHAYLTALVGLEPSMTASDRDHILNNICCAIPLAHIQSLHVGRPPLLLDFWRKTLGHARELRYLKLSDGLMPNLTSLLAFSADEPVGIPTGGTADHGPTPGHAYVPALEEFAFHRIMFSRGNHPTGDVISEKLLRDALSTRGVLCPRIDMFKCIVDQEEDGVYYEGHVSESSDEYY